MIKALATDLDGTLLYPKRPVRLVPSRNIKSLQTFAKSGGSIILVSGRGPQFCHQVADKINLPCTIIACSGAYIENNNNVIFEKFIPNTIVQEIEQLCLKFRNRFGIIVTTDDYQLVSKLHDAPFIYKIILKAYQLKNGKYNENIIVNEKKFNEAIKRENRGVLKVVLYLSDFIKGDRYQFAELMKQHISYPLAVSITKSGLEITPEHCDKGSALELVSDYLKIAKEEIVVVGDDGNDIPMFQKFPHSFIMSHGYDGAKEAAAHQINDFNELLEKIKELNKF